MALYDQKTLIIQILHYFIFILVCFSPEDNRVRTEIIFRGQGKVKDSEKKAYHESVDVYWQKNAWADTEFSCEWVERTLKPAVPEGEEFLLICDNLNSQTSDAFKQSVRNINGLVWFGLSGATDKWQPVDAGYGFTLKHLAKQEWNEWLDLEDENGRANIDLWAGSRGIPASLRRILITQWVGKATDKLNHSNYDNFRWNCFQKTGCLMTADGSDDDKIKPEGLSDYKVIDPLPIPGPNEAPNVNVEPSPEPLDEVIEDEAEEIPNTTSDNEEEPEIDDDESDRIFNDPLVGKKIRGLYESGWHNGIIDYFNTQLNEYRVTFEDESTDFITRKDIDGIEIVIIEEQDTRPTRSGRPTKHVDYNKMVNG